MQEATWRVTRSCSKVLLHNKTNRYLNSRWLSNLLFAAKAGITFGIYHIKGTFSPLKKRRMCAIPLQFFVQSMGIAFLSKECKQQPCDPTRASRLQAQTCKQRGQHLVRQRPVGPGWTLQPLRHSPVWEGLVPKKETADLHHQIREAAWGCLRQVNLDQIKANGSLYSKEPCGHSQAFSYSSN